MPPAGIEPTVSRGETSSTVTSLITSILTTSPQAYTRIKGRVTDKLMETSLLAQALFVLVGIPLPVGLRLSKRIFSSPN